MTKSLSARTFPLKNKYRCLKLDGKKILQHIENLIYIIRKSGPVAQRLEQWTHNPLVVGSNPTGPSDYKLRFHICLAPSFHGRSLGGSGVRRLFGISLGQNAPVKRQWEHYEYLPILIDSKHLHS